MTRLIQGITGYQIYILKNNGNQFLSARWYAVKDDMRKAENWELAAEEAILTGGKYACKLQQNKTAVFAAKLY